MGSPRFLRSCCRLRLPTGKRILSIGAVAAVAGLLLIARRRPTKTHDDAPPASHDSLEDAARCQLVSPGPAGYSMRDLLLTWPPSKPRGLIYTTVRPELAHADFSLIRSVYVHFNKRFNYPFVIFTDRPDAAVAVRRQLSLSKDDESDQLGQVFVYDTSRFWQPPPHVLEKHGGMEALVAYAYRSIAESGCKYPASIGYWLMCRFQSKGLVEIPFIQSFEYLWRLDTDAILCGQLSFDIFAHMKEHDYWQGYLAEDTWDSCAQRLTEAVHSYVQTYNIIPVQGNDSIKDARTAYIYNNFEIFKVQFYLSHGYRHFINFIDRSGGFFYYRWGDAPVRTQASRLFMPKEKMREFKVGEVYYRHQSFERCNVSSVS